MGVLIPIAFFNGRVDPRRFFNGKCNNENKEQMLRVIFLPFRCEGTVGVLGCWRVETLSY